MTSSPGRTPHSLFNLCFATVLAATAPAHAEVPAEPTEACQQETQKGDDLSSQGQIKKSIASYAQTAQTFPGCSLPQSHAATVLYEISTQSEPNEVAKMRAGARNAANGALAIDPDDAQAIGILHKLDFGEPLPRPIPKGPAGEEFGKAEQLFALGNYDDAITHYRAAIAIDPDFALAYVYLGDCYFSTKDYAKAEALYRQATKLDPLNGQAWRFLANVLLDQDKVGEVEDLLCQSIGAAPNDIYVWDYLESYLLSVGAPLERMNLRMHAHREPGEKTWAVDEWPDAAKESQNAVSAPAGSPGDKPGAAMIWAAYAAANIEQAKLHPDYSPFQLDFAVWQRTFEFAARSAKNGELKTVDPGLNRLYALNQQGLLKPALLLLAYREDYRPELEAWKKENPHGIREFIHKTNMQP